MKIPRDISGHDLIKYLNLTAIVQAAKQEAIYD